MADRGSAYWSGEFRMSEAERNADIARRYESGDTLKTISIAYNMTGERVRQILDAQGVQRRHGYDLSLETRTILAQRYQAGDTVSMLVEAFAISHGVVYRVLWSQGVPMRSRGPRFHPDRDANGKVCTGCHIKKPYSEFSQTNRVSDGYSSRCKACYRENRKRHYHRNRA